jgi:tryptophanyl-tRNA synthetase
MPHVPSELTANTREMAAALLACGLDINKAILFNQAQVPAHAELQWLLTGTARMGWLNRMTQFKDKSGKNREGASIALFTYPVLQAADVLLYQATHVPVGEDQKQHLELARDIAQKFNTDFGNGTDIFTLPDPIIPKAPARIMSLRDGSAKMSKSDPSDMSRINLTDDADTILSKIKKAKTDPEPLPSEPDGLEGRPLKPRVARLVEGRVVVVRLRELHVLVRVRRFIETLVARPPPVKPKFVPPWPM